MISKVGSPQYLDLIDLLLNLVLSETFFLHKFNGYFLLSQDALRREYFAEGPLAYLWPKYVFVCDFRLLMSGFLDPQVPEVALLFFREVKYALEFLAQLYGEDKV